METVPCPRCGRPVDVTTRRCEHDGFEIDSSHILAVATTINPSVPSQRTASARPEVDLVGTKLGRYVIEQLLGRGGMATVWRARHEELGGAVAIKVLDPGVVGTDDAQERFLREAKVSAQLNHDHVVKVIDFARDPQIGSCIVMELLAGRPLDRLLAAEGPLDESRAIAIALQITDALAAAHALGIVHRDLKPGNVFVTRSLGTEVVKVVDFGIAKLSVERATLLTRPGKLFGTPLYMSPEQWDDAAVGPASDVYSLGVVLYEMLTGRLPLTGAVMTEMAKQVALTAPRSMRTVRPELSPAIDAVVLRCLKKGPEERFASMHDLAEALRRARTKGRGASSGDFSTTKQVAGAVAVAAMAAAGVFLTLRSRSNAISPPAATAAASEAEPGQGPTPPSSAASDKSPTATTSASSTVSSPPSPPASSPTSSASAVAAPNGAQPHNRPHVAHDAGAKAPPPRPATPRPKDEDDLLHKN